jgi:hypothetical protein
MVSIDVNCVMPWVKPKNDGYAEAIKWQQENARYKIYSWIIEDMEMDTLLPHCLEVRRKILAVSSLEAHQGPSQFRVFPRTLSMVLQSIWDVIIDVRDFNEDTDGFDEALLTFIASHCTAEDRHNLVQQLRIPHKPREVNCQPFNYHLLELNSYVEWMPGTEEFFTEDQLRQSFYDGMPGPWRNKFVNAGKVVSDLKQLPNTPVIFANKKNCRFASNMRKHNAVMLQNVVRHLDLVNEPTAARRQKSVIQGQQQNNNPSALAPKIHAHFILAINGENALIMQKTQIAKKFCENSKQNVKITKTRNVSPILAMVLLSNNKTILLRRTMETPAMEMKIQLVLC